MSVCLPEISNWRGALERLSLCESVLVTREDLSEKGSEPSPSARLSLRFRAVGFSKMPLDLPVGKFELS